MEDQTSQEENSDSSTVKPTSLQQKMVALSGQNVDEFMKEMETVQKKTENNKEEENKKAKVQSSEPLIPPGTDPIPVPQHQPPQPPIPRPLMYTSGAPLRLPPGPPPGRPLMPPGPPPGLPPPRLPIPRMPPAPPRIIRLPGPPPNLGGPPNLPLGTPNVLSAAPQLFNRNEPMKQGATIMAKPQIRNLSADVTRFVPSTLRVKREDKKPKQNTRALANELKQKEFLSSQAAVSGRPSKDDAYMQFMKEMQGLL